jgi:hypothetical protein
MESDKEMQAAIPDPGSGLESGVPTAESPADADAGDAAPHATDVVVWDVPPAVVAGERFRMKVGIKCEHGCGLSNSTFEIHDHEGALAATATLPGDIWPGTAGLHVAEVELAAPSAEGLYTWSVNVPSTSLGADPGSEAGIPHAEASAGSELSASPTTS